MSDRVPGLAADDVARLLTREVKRDDGKDATAFNAQAAALKEMRAAVNEYEDRLVALEERPDPRPFFPASS